MILPIVSIWLALIKQLFHVHLFLRLRVYRKFWFTLKIIFKKPKIFLSIESKKTQELVQHGFKNGYSKAPPSFTLTERCLSVREWSIFPVKMTGFLKSLTPIISPLWSQINFVLYLRNPRNQRKVCGFLSF